MKGDLHLHSYYSDGRYSPTEVMRKAAAAGCDIVALTDHDTLDGIDEATVAARAESMTNIAGVEISAFDATVGVEAHILGYGFDVLNSALGALITAQKQKRAVRAQKLLANLRAHGIVFPSDAFDFSVKRELSRSHIADAMVRYGYAPDFFTAMKQWLHSGTPTFVPMYGVSPAEAIRVVHAAGGLAVLAHPMRLDLDSYTRAAFIRRLCTEGLDGLEAVYKKTARATVKEWKVFARSAGLFVTAGGDYHGDGNKIFARALHCEPILRHELT